MKKMKILLVTMDYPLPMGGIQAFTRDLEIGLKGSGHKVKLLNFDGRNVDLFKKFRTRDLFRTPATSHPFFSWPEIIRSSHPAARARNMFYNNLVYREARAAVEGFRPDIIHLTKPDLYAAIYGADIPSVVSCHAAELADIYPVRYALDKADMIHCVSNFARGKVMALAPARAENIEVIYNAVDLNFWRKFRQDKKNSRIITICRLVKRKNVDTAIRAFALLPGELRRGYEYLIIGDGPERPALEKLAGQLRVQKSVSFLGNVSDEKKAKLLGGAKLFVMCPVTHDNEDEGFGITYIEAQAAGVPVLASKNGGVAEAVGNGGLLAGNGSDSLEVSAIMRRLLTDQALYDNLLADIDKRISLFGAADQIKALEKLYEKIMKN